MSGVDMRRGKLEISDCYRLEDDSEDSATLDAFFSVCVF